MSIQHIVNEYISLQEHKVAEKRRRKMAGRETRPNRSKLTGKLYVPKKSTIMSNSKKIDTTGDGDAWLEIVIMNSHEKFRGRTVKSSKSLFYSVNYDIAVHDEPPSGASRIIMSPDSRELLALFVQGKKKRRHRHGEKDMWIKIDVQEETHGVRSLYYCVQTCEACFEYPPRRGEECFF
mmetsp:Transcript_38250/g.55894  ORF Transcript_38250/g.55894 Transcript_38250/m.55894 type:complete len:179 (+) Transcript_38250:118-654(+)